ncbi:MAG: hypothetical protein PVH15_14655, partial [Syntrophobacterales bacterium]
MGALVGANKFAYFRQQGLPIVALSDPRIGSTFSSFSVLPILSEEVSASVCVGLRLSLFSVLSVSLWLVKEDIETSHRWYAELRQEEEGLMHDSDIDVVDKILSSRAELPHGNIPI